MTRTKIIALAAATVVMALLGCSIVFGSNNLKHFDAALVGYAFATLFAAFGITFRYTVWLQRPPSARYWTQWYKVFFRFFHPRHLAFNTWNIAHRLVVDFAINRFIWRRGKLRWAAHFLIMWGCVTAAAITFPLVFGWIHFETLPDTTDYYQVVVFGFPTTTFPIDSIFGFVTFHALVWSSFMVIGGVLLAMQRRLRDHGAAALQQFGDDMLPLLLLFAISVTGLMLTASYTWMKGYGYDFLAILHALTVIFTLMWLPFGKFFHIFQRALQLGIGLYKEVGLRGERAKCRRCGEPFASRMHVEDLIIVERQLGYRYEVADPAVEHYQWICPKCRRALFGLAQGLLWQAPPAPQPEPALNGQRNGKHHPRPEPVTIETIAAARD